MNEIYCLMNGRASFLSRRHPLLKLLLALGLLVIFLSVPDRTRPVVVLKVMVLIVLGGLGPGFSHPKNWLRVLLFLAGFLAVMVVVTEAGSWLTGRGDVRYFRNLALRSLWVANISYLLVGSFHFRELVHVSGVLRAPAAISSQVLLILLIWVKFFEEFRQVPLAWKSRGLTPRYLRRRRGAVLELLKVVLLRTARRATRLEQALSSRGFDGRLYSFWAGPWRKADSATLAGAVSVMTVLVVVGTL